MPPRGTNEMTAWAIGLDMAYSVAGGLLLGALIDWLAGTRPWFMLGIGLAGLVAGGYRFISDAMRMNRASAGNRAPGRGSDLAEANPAEQEKPGRDGSPRG